MRCPRCNGHVMPGLTECFACGADLSAPEKVPATYPARNRQEANDLISRTVAHSNQRGQIRRELQELWAGLHPEELIGNFPPFWIAWAGMFGGLWFFRRNNSRVGWIVLGLELGFLLLVVISAAANIYIPGLMLLGLGAILGGGFLAVREKLEKSERYEIFAVNMMSGLAAVTSLFVGFLALVLLSRAFNDISMIQVNQPADLGGVSLEPGDRVILVDETSSSRGYKRGDIVQNGWGLYKIIALPGDTIELYDCEILVNGETVSKELWPLDERFERLRCINNLPPSKVEDLEFITIVRQIYYGKSQWIYRRRILNYDTNRLSMVVWPVHKWRVLP